MNKELKDMGNEIKEILDKYPHRQKEILFYIFGEDTIREIIKKPTYEELQQKVNQLETNRDETFKVINTQLKNANEYKDNLRIIKFHLIKGSCTFEDLKTEEDYKY